MNQATVEPERFQVGDRVLVTTGDPKGTAGKKGTVTGLMYESDHFGLLVAVEFEAPIPVIQFCGGPTYVTSWIFYSYELRLLSRPDPSGDVTPASEEDLLHFLAM